MRWRAAYDGHTAGVKEHYPTAPPDVKATRADGLRSVCLLVRDVPCTHTALCEPDRMARTGRCAQGESGTGKTCLAITMAGGMFPRGYIPRVFGTRTSTLRASL
jgi:hypothetical protein